MYKQLIDGLKDDLAEFERVPELISMNGEVTDSYEAVVLSVETFRDSEREGEYVVMLNDNTNASIYKFEGDPEVIIRRLRELFLEEDDK